MAEVDERALVLTATGRDARLTRDVLAHEGLQAIPCQSAEELEALAREGVGLLVLAEEMLVGPSRGPLARLLGEQPRWSDLPVLLLAEQGHSLGPLLLTFDGLGNVTILERPVQIATFVSAVRAALRARRRQYEARELVARLKQADRRKDEFLAMLGHELRNPLGVARTAVRLLDEADSPTDRQRQIARLDHQIRQLTRMVDDLLDLSRVSRGKIALQLRELDLREICSQAVEDCLETLDGRMGDLTIVLPETPVWVEGDDARLEQVIFNLLTNAAKYSQCGESIELTARVVDSKAVVEVRDGGIGIESDQLDDIFETFSQVESSLTTTNGGLGLGLSLSREILEMHGGAIRAESDGPGQGSTFVFELPVSSPRQNERDASDPGAMPRGGRSDEGLRILVVEDIAEARDALGELLGLYGYDVTLAADGEEAIRFASSAPPDVALVDIGLPDLDGYEVARRLRSGPGTDLRLVAMTGFGHAEYRERAVAAGFDRYLVKPVDPAELLGLLESA